MKNNLRSAALLALMMALHGCKGETSVSAPEIVEAETPQIETPLVTDSVLSKTENRVTIEAVPTWVKAQALPEYPESRADQTRNGIEYLLLDNQYRHNTGGYDYFFRMAFRVSDRKGLETAAQVKTSFDPSLSELSFNFINITRDGKTVDRLPNVEIREIQQESDLGKGIIDGDITALINLEDIRVGDVIDYSYSARVKTPLYPDMFFDASSVSYSVPVAKKTTRYDMPRNRRLYTEVIKATERVKIEDIDERTVYSFELNDPDPHRTFSNIPDGIATQGSLQVSTESSWSDIADWAVGVYDIDLSLPKSALSKIKSIRRAHKADGDRAMAALQWVQDDVRYLGFEEGVNGHRPRTPSVTLANGYGDCKDKSLLLQTVLSEMGITSYVTLVNTSTGDLLDQTLPAVTLFDHAIVMAEIDGRNVFMDPTSTYQRGGLENFAEPDYDFVLPIKSGQSELVKVDIPFEAYPVQNITENYKYEEDGSISLNVESIYNKHDADSMRRKVAKQGISKLTESYHDYYAERYPSLLVSSNIDIIDDNENNLLKVSESYSLSPETVKAEEYDKRLEVKAYSINGNLPDFIEPGRDFPLGLKKAVRLKHTINIHTPGREFSDQDDVEKSLNGVSFSLEYQPNGDVFSLIYDLNIENDRVALVDAPKIVELAEEVQNLASRSINLEYARKPLYRRLGLDKPIADATLREVQEINQLIQKKENVDALERVRKLSQSYTKKDALRGLIQQLQATVLIAMDRDNAALPLLDEAFSLFDPLDQQTYFSYAGLQNGKEDYVGAAETLIRVFDNLPGSSTDLREEWLWALYRNLSKEEEHALNDKLMISLAKAQLANLDEIEESKRVFGTAILAMGRSGQVEEAKDLYPYLYSASTYRDILMDLEMKALWEDAAEFAGEGLSKARQAEVDHALETAAKDKASYRDHISVIGAYLGNGQSEKAIEYGTPIYANWDRLVAEGEDGFWFANVYAQALDHAGRYEDSDKVFEKLMAIGLAQEGSLVSMALNQITSLVGRGEFQSALDKAVAYEDNEDFSASDFGMGFLYYVKACSQYQLGQSDEAAKTYEDQLLPIADENLGMKTVTLVCMERDDEAAKTLIARLESERHRPGTLPIYVTDTVPLDANSFTIDQANRVREIAYRPEVKKVFDKYGRSISITGPSEVWAEY